MEEVPEAVGRMSIGVALDGRLYARVYADEDEQEVRHDYVYDRGEMGVLGGWCVGFGASDGIL